MYAAQQQQSHGRLLGGAAVGIDLARAQHATEQAEVPRELERLARATQEVNSLTKELGGRLARYSLTEPSSDADSVDTALFTDAGRELREITNVAESTAQLLRQQLRLLAV